MRKTKHRKKKIFLLAAALTVCVLGAVTALLVRNRALLLNRVLIPTGSVKGVDLSAYQMHVDMEVLAQQDISFAYIKATEGSGFVDLKFSRNWKNAGKAGLAAGAYHFFSFDSPGSTQADNFINTAGDLTGALIPAVDVEYYGDKRENPPEKEAVVRELKAFLDALETEYGVRPMIYCKREIYRKYLQGSFDGYPFWVRSVFYPPILDGWGNWTVWQYCDRGQLDGYTMGEEYIDLNVLRRGLDLKDLTVPQSG